MKLVFAIIIGGACGALLRFFLSLKLNPLSPSIPLGTLTVNYLGAFIMGGMVYLSARFGNIPREIMAGVMGGFLGSLTTFSTFSAEAFDLISRREFFLAATQIILHVVGSIVLVFCGYYLTKLGFR